MNAHDVDARFPFEDVVLEDENSERNSERSTGGLRNNLPEC